jgi:hypothetical protein
VQRWLGGGEWKTVKRKGRHYFFFSLNNFCFGEKRPEPKKKKEKEIGQAEIKKKKGNLALSLIEIGFIVE